MAGRSWRCWPLPERGRRAGDRRAAEITGVTRGDHGPECTGCTRWRSAGPAASSPAIQRERSSPSRSSTKRTAAVTPVIGTASTGRKTCSSAARVAVVCGYGDVGKGCAEVAPRQGQGDSSPRSPRSEAGRRPWKATRLARLEAVRSPPRTSSSERTGNFHIITRHMAAEDTRPSSATSATSTTSLMAG